MFEVNLTDATITQIQRLTFLPDTDTIGFNPNDGLTYHTAGSESWTSDAGRGNGYRDHQYMETVNLTTGELTPIFNANPCPSPDTLPCFGLEAPRPSWVLPEEVRLVEETGDEFRARGENEYHALRALAWSKEDNLFYGSDQLGIFTMTTAGDSTFVGMPPEGQPKALAFVELNGETKLLMGDKAGGNLYEIDPETTEVIDAVELFFEDTGETISGLLGLAQHPETGVLYGIHKSNNPLDRELITVDPITGESTLIGFLEIHMAGLAFVSDPPFSADCNGDGLLDADDLACVATIEERDEVLAELNTLAGDLDGNGDVAFPDFLVLSNNFNKNLTAHTDGNIEFDDNFHQTANILVSYDGAAPTEILRWESDSASTNFHDDAPNEHVTIDLFNPAGANEMVLTFGLFDAGNDWWWAVDNISVQGVPEPSAFGMGIVASVLAWGLGRRRRSR